MPCLNSSAPSVSCSTPYSGTPEEASSGSIELRAATQYTNFQHLSNFEAILKIRQIFSVYSLKFKIPKKFYYGFAQPINTVFVF
jgi:hypothetical protein